MNCSDCKNTGTQICTVCCAYQGGVPDRWEPKPVTHYDRITSKTPEELAEWIASIYPDCPPDREGCTNDTDVCKSCWLDWLRQEARDG